MGLSLGNLCQFNVERSVSTVNCDNSVSCGKSQWSVWTEMLTQRITSRGKTCRLNVKKLNSVELCRCGKLGENFSAPTGTELLRNRIVSKG